jgi:hypothetical protein
MLTESITEITTALDALQTLALNETAQQRELPPNRRPSWAPSIAFLAELRGELEQLHLVDTDPRFGRIWSIWGRSAGGFKLVKFELRAGKSKHGRPITDAAFYGDKWHIGPPFYKRHRDEQLDQRYTWEEIESSERESILKWDNRLTPEEVETRLLKRIKDVLQYLDRLDRLETEYQEGLKSDALNERLRDLGLAEIVRLVTAPDDVMHGGALLSGICRRCGRTLTNPESVVRGIGPECIKKS